MVPYILAMTINGHSEALRVLIEHLAERGLIDRAGLATAFKDRAEAVKVDWADEYGPNARRVDVSILRALSDHIVSRDYPSPIQRGGGWSEPHNDG